MPSAQEIAAAVDAFMAAPKRIIGADVPPRWQAHWGHEVAMKYPLEVGGEQRGSQLMVVGFPRQRELKFRLGILFPAMICRLDYTDEIHANNLANADDGLPGFVVGPHFHSWALNRRFFHGPAVPTRLHNAIPALVGGLRSFDSGLRWFCGEVKIDQPPHGHLIDLPPPTDLLV